MSMTPLRLRRRLPTFCMRHPVSLHVRNASFGRCVGSREHSQGFDLLARLVLGGAQGCLELGDLLGCVDSGRARFVQLPLDRIALGPQHCERVQGSMATFVW